MKDKLKKLTAIAVAVIGGILGALGGAEKSSKLFRRIAIPILLLIVGLLHRNYSSWLIMFWSGILSIGYGIPDASDSGSALGRFWYKICRKNAFLANFMTKLTLGVLFSIVLAVIALLEQSTEVLGLTVSLAVASQVVFGSLVKGLGEIKLFSKKLTGIELARYATLTLAGAIQLIK